LETESLAMKCVLLSHHSLFVRIRFDILNQEMKTLMTQIDDVNLAANNLVESGHPRSGEVKQYQDRLNKR
jgi:spectrin beta